MRPAFPQAKIDLAKRQLDTGIARRNDDPWEIAAREARKLAYGADSPYARVPEHATVAAITRVVIRRRRSRLGWGRVLKGAERCGADVCWAARAIVLAAVCAGATNVAAQSVPHVYVSAGGAVAWRDRPVSPPQSLADLGRPHRGLTPAVTAAAGVQLSRDVAVEGQPPQYMHLAAEIEVLAGAELRGRVGTGAPQLAVRDRLAAASDRARRSGGPSPSASRTRRGRGRCGRPATG